MYAGFICDTEVSKLYADLSRLELVQCALFIYFSDTNKPILSNLQKK